MTLARKTSAKVRLDRLLVERGLEGSAEKAEGLILASQVQLSGERAEKAGSGGASNAAVETRERLPYVSRGGYKLAGALEHWAIEVSGRVCLDVGASTGGFTDCLLQRGAARVWCVDVGRGQLDWKVRNDPRVEVREGVNARRLPPADFPEAFDLAVCDASFISATMLIPAVVPLLAAGGEMIILVKPQFEVERGQVGKRGIVRDPELHQAACARVRAEVEAHGFEAAIIESPILGAEGNREFLLYASRKSIG